MISPDQQIQQWRKFPSLRRSSSRLSKTSTKHGPIVRQQSTASVTSSLRCTAQQSQPSLPSFASSSTMSTGAPNKENEDGLPQVSLRMLLVLNANEWWIIVTGIIAASIAGAYWPVFGLLYGEVLEAYSRPSEEVLESIYPFTIAMIATGAAVSAAQFFTVSHYNDLFVHFNLLIKLRQT